MSDEITTLSTKEIYRNRWMSLKEDRIRRADGSEGIYSVIEKGDFVVIVPVQDDEIFVVEQFRYPLGVRTLELPQGSWEMSPSAAPEEVAAGELREETGLIAQSLSLWDIRNWRRDIPHRVTTFTLPRSSLSPVSSLMMKNMD